MGGRRAKQVPAERWLFRREGLRVDRANVGITGLLIDLQSERNNSIVGAITINKKLCTRTEYGLTRCFGCDQSSKR